MQKKLPFINSAHGSETRNIINELIKLFNDMGYTYNEALQKAHDVLEEAQRKSNDVLYEAERVNAMNESVQQQINTLVAESGTSDAEVLQARVDLKGNTHNVLKERIDSTDYKIDDVSINVRNFGAEGDGNTNDRAAILAAKEEAIRLGAELYIPSGDFYINGDLDLTGVRFIKAIGSITFENSENKLTIAHDSRRANSKVYRIGDVFVGRVELLGMKNAEFHIAYTKHLRLFADSNDTTISSIAYNSFYPGRIDLLEYDSVGLGWVNENKWFGGRLTKVKFDGDYNHNHNIFYSPTIEYTAIAQSIELLKGNSNRFYDVRWEGNNGHVIFGDGTWDNVIERSWSGASGGYGQGSYRINDVVDNGTGNIITHSKDKYHTQNVLYKLSPETENYNTDHFIKEGNALRKTFDSIYEPVFDTGIFEVVDSFSFLYESDSRSWRLWLELYDNEMNLINNDDIINQSYRSFTMSKKSSGILSQGTENSRGAFQYNHNDNVRYVRIYILSYTQESFSYLNVFSINQMYTSQTIPNKKGMEILRGSTPPSGNWDIGTFVKNTNPAKKGASGWVLTDEGWIVSGTVDEIKNLKSETFTVVSDGTRRYFTIPHLMGGEPDKFNVIAGNGDTGRNGIQYINITGNNFVVFLNEVPPEGTEIILNWWAES